MTDTPAPSRPDGMRSAAARGAEVALFSSRWLMAPFYVGLVVSLVVLLVKFIRVLWALILQMPGAKSIQTIHGVLSLIDITLVANLILIVVFSGYENFVSRIDTSDHPEWPVWMTKIDFSGLKQKLLASIVAIAAVHLLEVFLSADHAFDATRMAWLVGVLLAFVVSALLLALSDRWAAEKEE
ncbi:MAG: TIGR00645 family protein [Bradyrhizobium sp.]